MNQRRDLIRLTMQHCRWHGECDPVSFVYAKHLNAKSFPRLTRFVLNDTYRFDVPLIYPPHLIAIASIFLALVLHPPACERLEASTTQMQASREQWHRQRDEASRAAHDALYGRDEAQSLTEEDEMTPKQQQQFSSFDNGPAAPTETSPQQQQQPVPDEPPSALSQINANVLSKEPPKPPPDTLTMLASLNVSLALVSEIIQEIISCYELWHRIGGSRAPNKASSSAATPTTTTTNERTTRATPATTKTASSGPDLVSDGAGVLKRLEKMREARRKDILTRGKR